MPFTCDTQSDVSGGPASAADEPAEPSSRSARFQGGTNSGVVFFYDNLGVFVAYKVVTEGLVIGVASERANLRMSTRPLGFTT